MRRSPTWFRIAVVAAAIAGGCTDASGDGGAGGGGGSGGVAGMSGSAGAAGMAGTPRSGCGPEEPCQADELCDFTLGVCVECLADTDCSDTSQACIDGACEERLCDINADCSGDTPQCTSTGCAACEGTVVTEDETEEGTCFEARGRNGTSPFDSDGCSADAFIDALRGAGYDIAEDEEEAVKDDPLRRVTEGVCSAPFGNDGDVRGACELHDYCYSTCGASRSRCDYEFGENLLETCRAHYVAGPCLTACTALAALYTGSVAANNAVSYLHNQGRVCSCCPDTTTCGDGACDPDGGEATQNCGDCQGGLADGAECVFDGDCASKHCSLHGECTPRVCVTNGDCPSEICNLGICLGRGLGVGATCTTSRACASGACAAGTCAECNQDAGCPAAEHCNLLGQCVPDLGNDSVCTANGECRSNICSAGLCAECVRDSQCDADEHCDFFGDCKDDLGNNAVCTSNAECRSNICSAGLCAECVRDSQCDSDEHCDFFGDCKDDLGIGGVCTANGECRSGKCRGICVP